MVQRRTSHPSGSCSISRGAGPMPISEVLAELLARYGETPAEPVVASARPFLVEQGVAVPSRQFERFAEFPVGASLAARS